MDDKTTIQELKDKVRKFCEDRDWDKYHNPKDLAIGIITEASERKIILVGSYPPVNRHGGITDSKFI
jgi:hypothetical protein